MQLSEIIADKIKETGPLSFHDFMEMALYYPGYGYYTAGKKRIGMEGDYYTSPEVSSLYGQMIGKQLEEMYAIMGNEPMDIIEFGAGSGMLCNDILNHLKKHPEIYNNVTYYIVEKNQINLNFPKHFDDSKIRFIDDLSERSGFSGCVISNELLDNFPVHLVMMKDQLMEIFVDYDGGFKEVLKPAGQDLENYLAAQQVTLRQDYRTEINLQVRKWIENIAAQMRRGYLLTIDYGYTAEDYYNAGRNTGTLACYYKHTVTDTPYANIGEQDITAHVNFSALDFWGRKYGFDFSGYCNQNYFLRSLGLSNYLRDLDMRTMEGNDMSYAGLNKLLLDMGNKFKVLIQQKNVPKRSLTGMQFSRQSVSH